MDIVATLMETIITYTTLKKG